MKRVLAILATFGLLAAACTGGGSTDNSSSSNGVTQITLWHGYGIAGKLLPGGVVNYEAKSIDDLISQFNQEHPDIHVDDVYCCTNDNALARLTVALNGGTPPDITYQYGTSMPQLIQQPKILNLATDVQDPSYDWKDFFPGARAAATVDDRVLGVPALIDNLAIVYNKDLFDQAHLAYPTADWTWDDFRAAAKALTDPSTKQYGWAFPTDASEDSVWHFDAMLWEAGGDILNADNTQAAFNSPAGLTAMTALRDMAVTDKSVYLDSENNGKTDDLFNSGNIGMLVTGPWALSAYPDVKYGVQIMPSFPGGDHQTISGPDMWVLFNNGDARSKASWEFIKWFTATQQVATDSLNTGHLPTRASVLELPGFTKQFNAKYPSIRVFNENLANVKKARPLIPSYNDISQVMGQAIVSVMLGEQEPQQALDDAAQQVNDILASS